MAEPADTARVMNRPPLAWGLASLPPSRSTGLVPLPFLPADLPARWLGAMVFVLGLALVRLGHRHDHQGRFERSPTSCRPRHRRSGPYRFTRTPFTRDVPGPDRPGHRVRHSLAAADCWWLFALVIRYGVVPARKPYLDASSAMSTVGYARAVRALAVAPP